MASSGRPFQDKTLQHERKYMKKQDSEETVSENEQIKFLMLELVKKMTAFQACRGKIGIPVTAIGNGFVKPGESANRMLKGWDGLEPHIRVMFSLLGQLNRRRYMYAHACLTKALNDPQYVLPTETFDLSLTRPICVFMPIPEATMTFLRWQLLRPDGDFLGPDVAYSSRGPLGYEVAKAVAVRCPLLMMSLQTHVNPADPKRFVDYGKVRDVVDEHLSGVLGGMRLKLPRLDPDIKRLRLRLAPGQNFFVTIDHTNFASLYDGVTAEEVRARLPKEWQDTAAMWQIDLPKIVKEFWVGIHPAILHESILKTRPSLTSRTTPYGFGCHILTDDPVHDKGHPYPVVRTNCARNEFGVILKVE